jgi:hypothetical protein
VRSVNSAGARECIFATSVAAVGQIRSVMAIRYRIDAAACCGTLA